VRWRFTDGGMPGSSWEKLYRFLVTPILSAFRSRRTPPKLV